MWVVLEELNFLPNGTWIGKEVLLSISEIILVPTNGLIGNSASVQSIAVRILLGCSKMILPSWSCHSVLAESNKMRLAGLPRVDVSFKKGAPSYIRGVDLLLLSRVAVLSLQQ